MQWGISSSVMNNNISHCENEMKETVYNNISKSTKIDNYWDWKLKSQGQ